ncbi:MAG: hypothetical protein AB7W37_05330 [Syntrophobacteraceae bacterium]
MTIDSDGTFTGSGQDSTGDVDNPTGVITTSSTGFLVSPTDESNPDSQCHVDAGNTVMACTDSWDSDAAYLGVIVRQAASYSTSDLAGDWNISALAVGPDGAFTLSNVESTGSTEEEKRERRS